MVGNGIIRFTFYDETYLIDAGVIIERYENSERKSIPYEQVKQLGSYIKEGLSPRLRYLDNVDALYFKEENSYGK